MKVRRCLMWKYGSVKVRQCGKKYGSVKESVAVSSVDVWKCGSIKVWQCESMAV